MEELSKKKQHKFVYIDLLLHNQVQETILVDKKFEAPGNNWHIERRGTSYFLIENYMEGVLVQDVEEVYEMGDWKYHIYWDERKSGEYFSISDMFNFSYLSYISIIYFCAFLGIAWIQSLPYPETSQIAVGSGMGLGEKERSSIITFVRQQAVNLFKSKSKKSPSKDYQPVDSKKNSRPLEIGDTYEERTLQIGDGHTSTQKFQNDRSKEKHPIWAETGDGEEVEPKFSKDADIENDKLTGIERAIAEAKAENLFGEREEPEPITAKKYFENTYNIKKHAYLHDCRRYRISEYIPTASRNRMEDRIREIAKSKRSSLEVHFFIDKNKTITSVEVFGINDGDAFRLKRDLQWMINMTLPYPKSCGYDIIMKLDFSDLS